MRLNSFINTKKFLEQYRNSLLFLAMIAMGLFLLTGCKSKQIRVQETADLAVRKHTALLNPSPAVQVEIHHININNGDASVILINHKDGTETKVIIDGGQPKPADSLLPYINAMFDNTAFDFAILTHYHNDHYNGLFALGDGSITSKYYIDLGGYDMSKYVDPAVLPNIQPNDITCPWTDSLGIFTGVGLPNYLKGIGIAAKKFGLERYQPMSKDAAHIQDMVGVVIPLGTFLVGTTKVPINLRSVAAWGYTQGNGVVVDNWKKGASKNDPTLGFVLECGEFRYFFGGDMGGQPGGSYIDQETTLAAGFSFLYKDAKSTIKPAAGVDGHVCGFKANHHGSDHSNNATFLGRMRPAVCVTSAGTNEGWHLPSIPFIKRLDTTEPITIAADIPDKPGWMAQGFFFTNLRNFEYKDKKYPSLDEAEKLFGPGKRAKTAFDYNKTGYVVQLDFEEINYTAESAFAVSSITKTYTIGNTYAFFCHKK